MICKLTATDECFSKSTIHSLTEAIVYHKYLEVLCLCNRARGNWTKTWKNNSRPVLIITEYRWIFCYVSQYLIPSSMIGLPLISKSLKLGIFIRILWRSTTSSFCKLFSLELWGTRNVKHTIRPSEILKITCYRSFLKS